MSENIYYERIKFAFKMQEDVYLSDLIFPDATPEFRNMFDNFSEVSKLEIQQFLYKIYNEDILGILDFFYEYCKDNYIHPVEVLAMKNDIIAFTDDKAKNLTRQFARLNRIKIVDVYSEEFDLKKHNRYVLLNGDDKAKILIGIDKRFNFDDLGKYFAHLGDSFCKFTPQKLKI
jgi:hypothetical protein